MTWLSSPLTAVDRLITDGEASAPPDAGSVSHFVTTPAEVYDLFYGRFSNEVLWFLQHSLPPPRDEERKEVEDAWQRGYVAANQAFAAAVVDELDRQV